jgi:mono/diheme cytochrome c family protein
VRALLFATALLMLSACQKTVKHEPPVAAKAFGSAIAMVSGEKQLAGLGQVLEQPVVVQVNDDKGTAVTGALVEFDSPDGVTFTPAHGLTGSDGQLTTSAALGGMSGHAVIRALTRVKSGKTAEVKIDETALGYQQTVGRELSDKYCSRCHDSESTAERVSNHDNLSKPPPAFSEGAIFNAVSDANLTATIAHGGQALSKSTEMPPFGGTLSKPDIGALIAYIRVVADPVYHPQGVSYGDK